MPFDCSFWRPRTSCLQEHGLWGQRQGRMLQPHNHYLHHHSIYSLSMLKSIKLFCVFYTVHTVHIVHQFIQNSSKIHPKSIQIVSTLRRYFWPIWLQPPLDMGDWSGSKKGPSPPSLTSSSIDLSNLMALAFRAKWLPESMFIPLYRPPL